MGEVQLVLSRLSHFRTKTSNASHNEVYFQSRLSINGFTLWGLGTSSPPPGIVARLKTIE